MSDFSSIISLLERKAPELISARPKIDADEMRLISTREAYRHKGRNRRLSPGVAANIHKLYQRFGNLRDTASAIGLCKSNVGAILRRRNLPVNRRKECPFLFHRGIKFCMYMDSGTPQYRATRRGMQHISLLRHEWEAINGRPMPAGHVIVSESGDPMDLRPENLKCITRAESAKRAIAIRHARRKAA